MNFDRPLPQKQDGDVFTLSEWCDMLNCGVITPWDGTGYQATDFGYDHNLNAFSLKHPDCTHIVWYNK